MPSQKSTAILLLSGTLALTNMACSRVNSLLHSNEPTEPVPTSSTPSTATNPVAGQVSPSVVNPSSVATASRQPSLTPQQAYERALDAAYSATSIAESAQSSSDWQLVINRWQEAIELLKQVPSASSYHAIAQPRLAEYQRNLRIAQQKSDRPGSNPPSGTEVAISPRGVFQPSAIQSPNPKAPTTGSTPTPASKTNTDKQQVFKAPIKRRVHGTPVIDVTFNGTQTFEMVVDTGASGTVVTQAMAKSLNIVPEGEIKANTASAKGVTFRSGKVESIAVNGAVAQNIQVAIGGTDLEIGLLGQNFFSKYDVSLKQDVVEFHSR